MVFSRLKDPGSKKRPSIFVVIILRLIYVTIIDSEIIKANRKAVTIMLNSRQQKPRIKIDIHHVVKTHDTVPIHKLPYYFKIPRQVNTCTNIYEVRIPTVLN